MLATLLPVTASADGPLGKVVLTDLSNNDPCRNKLLTNMISIMASNNAQLIKNGDLV